MAKENDIIEEMPEDDMGVEDDIDAESEGMDDTVEPASVEVSIAVSDYPGIEGVQVGDSLTVVSNDGSNIVLTLSAEPMTDEIGTGGEGATAIAGEF